MRTKIFIIGAGRAGANHLAATRLAGNRQVHVAGVYDVDVERSRRFSDAFGIESLPSMETIHEACGINDLIIICTPPSTHVDLAMKFVRQNCSVLIEKPLDAEICKARRLATGSFERHIAVVAQHRFSPGFEKLKSIISATRPSEIMEVSMSVKRKRETAFFDDGNIWRTNRTVSGGGVLITVAIHYLDLLLNLFGVPEVVKVDDIAFEHGVERFVLLSLRYGYFTAKIHAQWGDVQTEPDAIHIRTKTNVLDFQGGALSSESISSTDKHKLISLQLHSVLKSIETNSRMSVTPADVLPALELINTVYEEI
jgi:predicted dehydrogenase